MRIAELCAGYGGLGLALEHLGHELEHVWYSELHQVTGKTRPNPAEPLMRQLYGIPNLGDLTQITEAPQVDIVAAGFPCQPLSNAGNMKGIHDDRWIIDDVCRVARIAGAETLILENVSSILTANNGHAMAHVCAAMAREGFSRWEWGTIRASATLGACHSRERWFCIASTPDAEPLESDRRTPHAHNPAEHLLPTPTASQPGGAAAQHLERKRGGKMNRNNPTVTDLGLLLQHLTPTDFLERFGPALESHAQVVGRPWPSPTDGALVSPLFVEWMMTLPEGHVTDLIENPRAALHVLGNGVVPLQAAAELSALTKNTFGTPNPK